MKQRVAVIGSGPSGCYVIEHLLKTHDTLHIDCYDQLPFPFGLLRTGIAPDHIKMKKLSAYYEKIFLNNADRVHFFGNIHIGKTLTIDDLKQRYQALFICTGSNNNRRLPIRGIYLPNVITSRDMASWYNGHPDFAEAPCHFNGNTAIVIGLGNVAIDVARMLLKKPDQLDFTSIPSSVMKTLSNSKIDTVHLIGRRGPVQAAYTPHEIEELCSLEHVGIHIKEEDFQFNDADTIELSDNKNTQKKCDILKHYATKNNQASSIEKHCHFHFFSQPKEYLGTNAFESILIEKTTLKGDAHQQKAIPTQETYTIDGSLCVSSIGYLGTAVEGLPFDDHAFTIPNQSGRIVSKDENVMLGLYTAGWIKRGAQGVIGTNKRDAIETVNLFNEDLPSLPKKSFLDTQDILAFLSEKECTPVSFDDWKRIDKEEQEKGKSKGKIREKFIDRQDYLNFLNYSK